MFKKTLFFLSVTCFLLLSLNVSVLAATVYGNRLIDFNNHRAWTVYGSSQATGDFGNYRVLQGGNRLKIDNAGRLRFELPKGSLGSSQGGGIIKANIAEKRYLYFSNMKSVLTKTFLGVKVGNCQDLVVV